VLATAPGDEDVFLADVVSDPGEMRNLAEDAQFANVATELSEALDGHAQGAVEVPPECLRR
jgi:hypothetical protein